MSTVVAALFEKARQIPKKTALIVGDDSFSYDQLAKSSLAVATQFRQHGIGKGDFILLSADASPAFVYGYFAAHLISAIVVPIDPRISHERLQLIVEKVQPKAVFTVNEVALQGANRPALVQQLESLIDYAATATTSGGAWPDIYPHGDVIADVLFTSGTTGDAKGVMLPHSAIFSAANHINTFIGNGSDDIEVMPLPLSHSFGLGRLRCSVLSGSTIILVPGLTNLALIFQALRKHKATGLASVPAGFALLLKLGGQKMGEFADQLRYIEIGSSPMPAEHKAALMTLLPQTRICMHYGLTEASRSVFIEFHADKQKLDSIGKPSPGVQVCIADDNGHRCKVGASGRILVKGPHCTTGYWNDREKTRDLFVDGWLDTGDYGYSDQEGYLYLEARRRDLINVGGLKVAPSEVEQLIVKHPLVQECACVAMPDPRGITGQAVKAFIVPVEGAEPPDPHVLTAALQGRIEPYKIPAEYELIDQIPKTESGKIQRSALSA